MLNGFVSYAHADQRQCGLFFKHLKLLEGPGIASFWTDHGIEAGDPWKDVIVERLEAAQVALFVISPDFFWSDFIKTVEWPLARRRMKADDLIVIPVILRPTTFWEKHFDGELGARQAVPLWGKAITESKSRDGACAQAVKMIGDRIAKKPVAAGGPRRA